MTAEATGRAAAERHALRERVKQASRRAAFYERLSGGERAARRRHACADRALYLNLDNKGDVFEFMCGCGERVLVPGMEATAEPLAR